MYLLPCILNLIKKICSHALPWSLIFYGNRELRKHQSRKAQIYSRPPLDPALLDWAQDFKAIQIEKQAKRAVKMDNMQKEWV